MKIIIENTTLILFLILFSSCTNFSGIKKEINTVTVENNYINDSISGSNGIKENIIFISDSNACECIFKKCEDIRKTLYSIIDKNSKYKKMVRLTEIDYAKTPEKVNEIFEEYKLWFIPSVILEDNTGKIYYKSSFDFDEIKFIDALNLMVNTNFKESK